MFLPMRCPGCGEAVSGPCQVCAALLAAGARCVPGSTPFAHSGHPRQVVLGLKYRNARHAARLLAPSVAASVESPGLLHAVTWTPTTARRLAQRGYDPAELLAREVARLLGLPCRRLLYRSRRSSPQAGKDRLARLVGPEFIARPFWARRRILLIDDVTTTGATLRSGANALLRAGAAEVQCLAATAAP